MLIINFKNNIPQQNHYSFSVVGNNKSNKIKFVLDRYQDEVDLSEFSAYVKVMADGGDFVDIMPLSHSVVGSEIEIVWELKRKTTQFSIVECQLSFKKTANDDSVVWQSAIFGIELLKSIKAEEEIPDKYPSVLENIEKELDDHEERIEELENGQGINEIVVGNPSDYENENGVKKLIRKEDEEGAIHETYVIDKDHIPHEFVDSEPTSTNNGTQLNTSAKVKSDLSRYEDVFGSAVIEPLNNAIYTAYYNKNGEITKAIRIGVASRYGALEITGLEPNKEIKLTIGGYFRYDENDEKVFDSNCYLYIEDKDHSDGAYFEITEERQEFNLVANENGFIYLDNNASSLVEEGEVFGRLFVYGFEGEIAEHTEYHAKQLAKKEDVEEVHQEVVETNERVGQAEDRISACEDDIADLQDEVEKMGDVQIFDRTSLPTPSEQYLKKIFRVNGVLFQCVKVGDNLDETFDFANVSGTQEITTSSFNDFAEQVGEGFAENVELYDNNEWFDFIPVQIIQSEDNYYATNVKLDLSGLTFFTIAELSNCDIDDISSAGGYHWAGEPLPDFSGIQQITFTSNTEIEILSNNGGTYSAISDEQDGKMEIGIYNANPQLFNNEILPYLRENQEVQPIAKLFRNNGDIRLGNSSTKGQFIFHTKTGIPFHEVRVELQAWSSTKSSAVKMALGSSMASVVIPKGETRTLTVVDEGEDNTLFALTTEKVGTQDPRVIIKSMYIRMGEASYEWKAVGGGVSESLGNVEIEKVWLTYDDRNSIQTDYLGGYFEDDQRFVNDSTRIWVNFKTTPISSGIEEEINKGRFIIRLDYPSKSRNYKISEGYGGLVKNHQPQADYGVGARSFCPNFIRRDEGANSRIKTSILKSSMIYIEPSDIKTNRYGEKYIHKQISFFDYINKTCVFYNIPNKITLYPLTLDNIMEGDEFGSFFEECLDGNFSIGIPSLNQNGDNRGLFTGSFVYKCYSRKNGLTPNIGTENDCRVNGKKINPAFSCYTPLVIKDFRYDYILALYSPFWNNHHSAIEYAKKDRYDEGGQEVIQTSDYYTMFNFTGGQTSIHQNNSKRNFMVAKPRCAILSDNWETDNYAFLKTFPQADQQIKLLCKAIRDIDDYNIALMPVFRIKITAK